MKNTYIIDYVNENEFKKKERSIKKYNMLAYKKLLFEYYPSLKEGNFLGVMVSTNSETGISKYELKLPTDKTFSKVHGDTVLHYSLYDNRNLALLNTLTPEDILTEGHQTQLSTYKGVMVSNSHKEQDIFKINLLNALNKNGYAKIFGLLALIIFTSIIIALLIIK